MDIKNLEVGLVVKNYKELCELLGLEVKSGKSKTLQVKDMERYFSYTKSGNKFIIESIFEKPVPKVDKRSEGNNSIYGELAQILLIDMLSNSKTKSFSISKSKLISDLSLANKNYTDCKSNLSKLSKYLEMDIKYIYDFYNINDSTFTGIITRALKNLQDKRIIKYNTVYKIKLTTESSPRTMNEKELVLSNKCEKETLEELGYLTISDVRRSSDWKHYKSKVIFKMREFIDVEYHYQAYDIAINDEYLESEKLGLINIIKNKKDRLDKSKEMNDLILSEFNKKLEKRINDDNGKNLEFKRTVDYRNNNIKLSNIMLNSKSASIIDDVKKVESSKTEKYEEIASLDLPF